MTAINPSAATRYAVKIFVSPKKFPRGPEEEIFWRNGQQITFASGCVGRTFGESDKVIWLVPGWESRCSKFKLIIEACVKAGFKIVAWDGPGHGDSPGSRANMVHVAKLLVSDVTAFSNVAIYAVIGHSFGGNVAAFACKVGLKCDRLILIAAPGSIANIFVRFWRRVQLPDAFKPLFTAEIEKETGVNISEVSIEAFIAKLSQKIQIIHDKLDKEVPYAEAEALKAKNPAAVFVSTEKLGHRRILDSQIVASLVVKFLV
ncbi:MAG: alpha/beta fold hydrolase [Bdellovibrio sp.]|nr:alpha/beta fold hydrolase [Bdellovibrio sp.]